MKLLPADCSLPSRSKSPRIEQKKFSIFIALLVLLSGCATYTFQKGVPPYDAGYVVARSRYVIPEYTLGNDNTVPDALGTAEARFKRRKSTVEQYYEKMGYIKTGAKELLWDPPVMIVKLIGGLFRLPFIAASNYKYNHDPKYKEQVDRKQDAQYEADNKRVSALKGELNAYVQKDLASEPQVAVATAEVKPEVVQEAATTVVPEVVAPVVEAVSQETAVVPAEVSNVVAPETIAAEPVPVSVEPTPVLEEPIPVKEVKPQVPLMSPEVVITAKPLHGYSPLKVQFSGSRSHSPNGKIIAYEWDFGDRDTSSKPNPTNTFYSASFSPRQYIVALTVTDSKGATASSTIAVEVLNK